MLLIGITGGIGSGKSIVSKVIRTIGYPVYDTDWNAKRITDENGEIRQKLTDLFGLDLYENNRLNRKFLAQKIFSDKQSRLLVNAIIHPVVLSDFLQWIRHQKSKMVFIESAILFESGFGKFLDKIIVVTSPLELRIARILQRDRSDCTEVQQRILAQSKEEEMIKKSHFIVKNDEKKSLIKQIYQLINEL